VETVLVLHRGRRTLDSIRRAGQYRSGRTFSRPRSSSRHFCRARTDALCLSSPDRRVLRAEEVQVGLFAVHAKTRHRGVPKRSPSNSERLFGAGRGGRPSVGRRLSARSEIGLLDYFQNGFVSTTSSRAD
jgi:hypothetical protein